MKNWLILILLTALAFLVLRFGKIIIEPLRKTTLSASASAPKASLGAPQSILPSTTIALGDLTQADYPPSITLLKTELIPFKKGCHFIAKAGTPLFFMKDYIRDAKSAEPFEILDYNPIERRVFLRSKDSDGNTIALNALDLHGSSKEIVTVPPNTVVSMRGLVDGNALVAYNGDRFLVPVGDTDLLSQVTQRRAQNLVADENDGVLSVNKSASSKSNSSPTELKEMAHPTDTSAVLNNMNITSPGAQSSTSVSAQQTSIGNFGKYSKFIVTIEGDNGSGTGFLVKWGQWNAVATNAHVLGGNKVIKITTLDGRVLRTGRLAVAKNIDLALVEVNYSGPFLPVSSTLGTDVQEGDEILVLGNSEGEGVVTNLNGSVIGIGPDRIEVDAQFVEGNSGSPVIHIKSGKAIGIATYYQIANINEFSNKSAAVKDSPFWTIRRFAFRLDAVQGFDFLPIQSFSSEAARISEFDETTENIYLLAADLAFNDTIHMDWHHRRLNRLAIPVQEYVEKTQDKRTTEHNSMDPRQEFLTRLAIECTADINLYRKDFISSYYIRRLNDIIEERQRLRHQIDRLLTQ